MQHRLDINYTLIVLPENELFSHLTSVMALTDVCKSLTLFKTWSILFLHEAEQPIILYLTAPPAFDAACSESGISFKLDHRPFDYLWEISIGSDLLTSELAAQHGYIMSNDSQTLQLDVPLFTHGYKYEVREMNYWKHQLLCLTCLEHGDQ